MSFLSSSRRNSTNIVILFIHEIFIYLIKVNLFIDISVTVPGIGYLELEVTHIQLQSLSRPITIPELQTPLNIFKCCLPVTLDVALKRLSKYRIKLLNMLLQANNIAVECEHVVDALISKALNINSLILLQLDQLTYFVILRNDHLFHVVET